MEEEKKKRIITVIHNIHNSIAKALEFQNIIGVVLVCLLIYVILTMFQLSFYGPDVRNGRFKADELEGITRLARVAFENFEPDAEPKVINDLDGYGYKVIQENEFTYTKPGGTAAASARILTVIDDNGDEYILVINHDGNMEMIPKTKGD